jgi:two-component system phosphate regulon response regulator PhoB
MLYCRSPRHTVAHILVVEDDLSIQELVSVNLTRAGHRVECAGSAERARDLVHAVLPDMALVDWMLPGMSGLDFARRLRADSRSRQVAIIMVTGRCEERDVLAGLAAGADDYITKPFSVREMLARISAVLRRTGSQAAAEVILRGPLRLDPVLRRASVRGAMLPLGDIEVRLLHYLMLHPGRVHSRAHLLDQVWGNHAIVDERMVDAHVRRLRTALLAAGMVQAIRTVRGSGYAFVAAN